MPKPKNPPPQGTLEPRFFVLSPCAKAQLASDTRGSSPVETAFFQISTFIGLTTNDDWNLIFTSKYKQQGEIRLQRSNWWLLLLQGGVLVAIKVDKVPSWTALFSSEFDLEGTVTLKNLLTSLLTSLCSLVCSNKMIFILDKMLLLWRLTTQTLILKPGFVNTNSQLNFEQTAPIYRGKQNYWVWTNPTNKIHGRPYILKSRLSFNCVCRTAIRSHLSGGGMADREY